VDGVIERTIFLAWNDKNFRLRIFQAVTTRSSGKGSLQERQSTGK